MGGSCTCLVKGTDMSSGKGQTVTYDEIYN